MFTFYNDRMRKIRGRDVTYLLEVLWVRDFSTEELLDHDQV